MESLGIMEKNSTERYQKRVERTVAKWQTVMDLGFFAIDNYFSDIESKNIAEVITSWEYREAAIIWYNHHIKTMSQDELNEAAVHELGHIIVAPMSDHLPSKHIKLEEFVVSSITKAIIGVHNEIRNTRQR